MEKGGKEYGGGGRRRLYTYRYTVTTRMTCIKMGGDKSHFNVSLIVRDKITRQCPQTTIFFKERRIEADSKRRPFAYQPNALPLGKTVSRRYVASTVLFSTTQTFRSALTASVDSCTEMKIKCPFSGVTSCGRVWKQVSRKARLGMRVLGNPNNSRAEEPEDVDLHRLNTCTYLCESSSAEH